MKALWARYIAWFSSRQPRERVILAFASVVGVGVLGFNLFLDPALLRGSAARRGILEARAQLDTMREIQTALTSNAADPDAPLRLELARLQATRAEQAQRFRVVERSVVPPQAMPELLQELLGKAPGIELLGMKSLAPESLLHNVDAKARAPGAVAVPPPPAAGAADLYRHGIELRLAGGYQDVLNYLVMLEERAPNLGWGPMELSVEKYPRCELSLTVYSISLDAAWLIL